MNPDRFSRLKEIVLTVGMIPVEERDAYIAASCNGDDEMKLEVISLLEHEGDVRAPIETAGLENLLRRALATGFAERFTEAMPRRLPERIGPYRIVGLLGEGGMGTVYRAEQSEPIQREVALKLLRSGLDSASVLARFELERKMLARIDHPNVATILDAGAASDGQPYFVMELVRGVPITDYCRAGRLSPRERVLLFLDVCRAVRQAHRRGIVHRDLKPSNILVTVIGGRPVPKVIDFSIAKAVDAPDLETVFRTRTGQVIGTLEYMSPEQARGAVAEIDTRSDVYSLGVILYELLTDRLPLDLSGLPLHEAVRRIVEEPPPRLRRSTGSTTSRTAAIDLDLATIAAQCLDKDPERRYGSALELTEEIERYVESRPISARPPSRAYLLRKLIARHRVAFGVAGLVLTLLVGFAITVSVQLSVQRRERARAETEARKAEHVVAYIQEVLLSASAGAAGHDVTIREALEYAAGSVHKNLGRDPEGEAAVEQALGMIERDLGDFDKAEIHLQEALRIRGAYLGENHPDVGQSWLELANLRFFQGNFDEAETLGRRAVGILQAQSPPDSSAISDSLNTVGLALSRQGKLEESLQVLREAVSASERIPNPTQRQIVSRANQGESVAGVLRRLGRYREAEPLVRRSLEVKTENAEGRTTSGVATATYNLASVLHLAGRYSEAEQLLRRTREMEAEIYGVDDPSRAVTTHLLSEVLRREGAFQEAEELAREAIDIHRKARDLNRTYLPADLGVLTRILAATGRTDEAIATAQEAFESVPTPTAANYATLADALEAAGRWEEARDAHRKALEMLVNTLPPGHPGIDLRRVALARTLMQLGDAEEAADLLAEALPSLGETLGREHPDYAVALRADAERLRLAGRESDAEAEVRQAALIETRVKQALRGPGAATP